MVALNKFSRCIFVLCIFAVVSCRSNVTSVDDTCYNIREALDNCADVPLSRYVSDIEYIPLETNEKSSLMFVFDINTDGKYLYVYNGSNPHYVLVFDQNGKYISQINRSGRGPGEYLGPSDFCLESDLAEQYACLFDDFRILVYEDDGKCVRELDIKEVLNANVDLNKSNYAKIFRGVYLNEGRYAVLSTSNFRWREKGKPIASARLLVVDTLCNILKDEDLGYGFSDNYGFFIHSYKGNLRLSKGFPADTIVFYDNNLKESSQITFDYSNSDGVHDEFITGIEHRWNIESDSFMWFCLQGRLNAMPKVFSQGWRTDGWHKDRVTCYLVLDKASNKMCALPYNYEFKAYGFKNDIDGGAPFQPLRVVGNKMYQAVDALKFIEYAQKSSSPKMKEVAATLTEESNHVLVVATLK